jgi:hypothetical protein
MKGIESRKFILPNNNANNGTSRRIILSRLATIFALSFPPKKIRELESKKKEIA